MRIVRPKGNEDQNKFCCKILPGYFHYINKLHYKNQQAPSSPLGISLPIMSTLAQSMIIIKYMLIQSHIASTTSLSSNVLNRLLLKPDHLSINLFYFGALAYKYRS